MTFRDFDAARAERARAIMPIRFRLGGQEFTLAPRPSLFDAFALAAAPDPDEDVVSCSQAIAQFIDRLCIDRRNRRRWNRLLRRRRDAVDAETLVELGAWLAGEYAGRPTVPSGDSSPGRLGSGEPSSSERYAPASDLPT